ncbi:Autophagy protein 5 [Intoshia linei]|uniref:Autophagy protein 5 n=1 Tax=Intoshia linei TaxID=1819745 RepID=A0A177BD08_9BILA|nr:Autophagy protein 5 [Intoshia linei]
MDGSAIQACWQGKIPVIFQLENKSDKKCSKLLLLVSRISYFPILLDKIINHFNDDFTKNNMDTENIWLKSGDCPIRWQYPIGVIFDIHSFQTTKKCYPWVIDICCKNVPPQILRIGKIEAMKIFFISSLKQSDNIRHNSSVISSLLKNEVNQLWNNLKDESLKNYWEINKKLMNPENYRNVPFRIYVVQEFKPLIVLQKRVSSKSDTDGKLISLLDLLNIFFENSNQI